MKEPSVELDDASYQLMMAIQTGQMVNTPRPARGWMLLGLVTVVLGGLAALLLASGNRTSATADLHQAPLSTATVHTPRPLARGPQDLTDGFMRSSPSQHDTPSAYKPLEESGSEDVRPSSDHKAGRRTKNLSASPRSKYAPKPANAPPVRISKPRQESGRLQKDRPQRDAQHRSRQFWGRSPASDFDPNADLVRSSP
jgi:hypothetical protein